MIETRYPRDPQAMAAIIAAPLPRYSVQPRRMRDLAERVLASCVILGTMVAAGVLLGSDRRPTLS